MPPVGPSDHELATRAAAGDAQAFEALAHRHWPALVRYARGRLTGGLEHLAEDAVQEASIKALRALRGGTVPPEPRPWLYVIVRNCCSDLRRGAPAPVELPEDAAAPAPDVHEAVASADRLDRVVHAIDHLPPGQRRMLIGREFEGRSYEQLATAHATTVSAVKSALVRARRNLAAAPGVYGIAAPFAWLSRRLGMFAGREAGLEAATGGGAAAGGVALAAMAATAVTIVPFVPLDRSPAHAVSDRPALQAGSTEAQGTRSRHPEGSAGVQTPESLLARCAAGLPLDDGIPRAIARRALRELSADVAEYSTCRADLRRAELDALSG